MQIYSLGKRFKCGECDEGGFSDPEKYSCYAAGAFVGAFFFIAMGSAFLATCNDLVARHLLAPVVNNEELLMRGLGIGF